MTEAGVEIDLVIKRPGMPKALVQTKSADRITERDTEALERFTDPAPPGGILLTQGHD